MADRYVFADEAGNFDFSRKQGASQFYILTTVTVDDCGVGDDLLALRREIAWDGLHLDKVFHATEDPQAVRDRVFDLLGRASFRIDTTILDKRKAQPHLQAEAPLYKMAWYLHFKYVAPRVATRADRLLVAAATLGTKAKQRHFYAALNDVVSQVSPCASFRAAFWPAMSDPCLQVADYCTWAIQRKWELNDTRSWDLIADKVRSEFRPFARGTVTYY